MWNRWEEADSKTQWTYLLWNLATSPSSKVLLPSKAQHPFPYLPRSTTSHHLIATVAEDYTEDLAVAHVRRLLDIVACTSSFGSPSSSPKKPGSKEPASSQAEGQPSDNGVEPTSKPRPGDKKLGGAQGGAHAHGGVKASKEAKPEESEKGDIAVSMCPPPRLGQFYDFFSFSHLTPPIQCGFSLFVWLGGSSFQWHSFSFGHYIHHFLMNWEWMFYWLYFTYIHSQT